MYLRGLGDSSFSHDATSGNGTEVGDPILETIVVILGLSNYPYRSEV